jgi:superkiller protein 3
MKYMRVLAPVIAVAIASQSALAESQTVRDLLRQGDLYQKERRYLDAEAAFRQAIALNPRNPGPYWNLGFLLREQKKYAAAEEVFRQVIKLDPRYPFIYRALADFLKEQQKYSEAETVYRQGIALDPKRIDLYGYLGNLLEEQQKYKEAQEVYQRAIALDPSNADYYPYLGSVLKKQGFYAHAEDAYRQGIARDPRHIVSSPNRYADLIDLLKEQQKFVEAEEVYRQAIAHDPRANKAVLYRSYGDFLTERGNYPEAAAMYHQGEVEYRQLIEFNPKESYLYNGLAYLLKSQKKYSEAESVYRRAIALDPEEGYLYNNLAFLFQELNRLADAREYYKKAILKSPGVKDFRANLEEIERLISIADGTEKELLAEDTRFLPQNPLTTVRRSVVVILPSFSGPSTKNNATRADGRGYHGTGFVVQRQGGKAWILTARHVIRDPEEAREATNIQVKLYGGNLPPGLLEARILARRVKIGPGDVDLALLEVDALPKDIQPLRFAQRPVEENGIPLTMVGHPFEDYWKSERGTLSKANKGDLVIFEEQWDSGGSGSPILTANQEVIGIVYATRELVEGIKVVLGYSLPKLQSTMSKWGQ